MSELRGAVLVLNAGSSSLKFAVYEPAGPTRRAGGKVDRLGRPDGTITWDDGTNEPFPADRDSAAEKFLERLASRVTIDALAAVGHRVVHGGPRYDRPTRIDDTLLAELRKLVPFDPEHLPLTIALIEAIQRKAPAVPQTASFDTAFHRDLPDVARRLPIPRKYHDRGVRRYGFHGLSFTYMRDELARRSGGTIPSRVVFAHLGNGSSLAAVRDGRSIDTTMGLSPAGGIPMSTRSGDLDPGVIQYIWATEGLTPQDLRDLTTRKAGLLGVSETSGDFRDLLAREAEDPKCREAVDLYCYAVRKQIGAYAAALGGLDALVFGGGVGEHAAPVRARICDGLGFLGVTLDEAKNAAGEPLISAGSVPVHVIRTDEESVIAREALALLSGHR
jgi:acetate kinase